MTRIKKEILQEMLDSLNDSTGRDLVLSHEEYKSQFNHGGWTLENRDGKRVMLSHISSRDMWLYLRGAVDFIVVDHFVKRLTK